MEGGRRNKNQLNQGDLPMSDTGVFVYVVDDDVSAREGVARLIRSAGWMAKTFSSGEVFLASPRPKLPSCVVLDMNLPGLTNRTRPATGACQIGTSGSNHIPHGSWRYFNV